ncbi:hydroxyisourate hydrolase [Belnapia sp. T18]|uniref:5-hydroxyisourate hydrolase n=1 Tax=Belnapia arida TaxID=2804533 RepID=A0ABS1U433_9PROT|nr:hydroxyisourate hydrolase [Belnapia arida]MBL6079433.1 hydroxyisourate hydrolase [Belnapia arida]
MAGYLSTHVLNTAEGVPGAGIAVELWRLEPAPVLVARTVTTVDGRNRDAFYPEGAGFVAGLHELRFGIGAYFAGRGPGAAFYDVVPVRVRLEAGQGHYHVPLLCSPFGYTTYRGS